MISKKSPFEIKKNDSNKCIKVEQNCGKYWKLFIFINFQVFICVLAVVSCAAYANAGSLGAIAALSSGGGYGGGYGGGDEGYSYEAPSYSGTDDQWSALCLCFGLFECDWILLFRDSSACAYNFVNQ